LVERLLRDAPDVLETLQLQSQTATALNDPRLAAGTAELAERAPVHLDLERTGSILVGIRRQRGAWRLYESALELEQKGRLADAADAYRMARNAMWLENIAPDMAHVELRLGNHAAAREILETQLLRSGPSAATLERLGDLYLATGEDDRARESWETAVGMIPSESLHDKLAEWFDRRGEPGPATQHRGRALHVRGVRLYRQNELSPAQAALQDAVGTQPDRPDSWYYLGLVARALGQRQDARKALEHCLSLNPDYGRAVAALAALDD
jgi:tetratricopeptide (TPR) repeat protein